ncbi:MAG: hypothetical protein WAM69_06725, partial [Candidatus Sulfotelmatobacter sp.]
VLEDANSIQVSLMQIMRLIVAGQLDAKTAGLLLYVLQTASANLARTTFAPYMNDVVLDPRTVNETPLSAHIWEDSDFDSAEDDDDDEVLRVQALEEAQRRARRKTELDRWAEAEADRLAAIGARQREAERQAERKQEAEERAAAIAQENAKPAPAVTPAGRAVLPSPPTVQPPGKRPSANVSMDEVRKQVTAQIRKALPEIAAAQSGRERSSRENGKSAG